MDREQAFRIMNTLRPIIDERLVYFAYYNDEPIGFFIMVPDLNRVIRFLQRQKFGWWNKLRLMWALKVAHKADRIFGLIFGVTPSSTVRGIEAGIIRAFEGGSEVALQIVGACVDRRFQSGDDAHGGELRFAPPSTRCIRPTATCSTARRSSTAVPGWV